MNSTMRFSVFAFSALLVAGSSGNAAAQQATMSFFVTRLGPARVPTSAAWQVPIASANS